MPSTVATGRERGGTDVSDRFERRAFQKIVTAAIPAAITASTSQIVSHSQTFELVNRCASPAAMTAVNPMHSPPHPGIEVKEDARSIVSRMRRMFVAAWS